VVILANLIALLVFPIGLLSGEEEEVVLCRGHYQTEEEARLQLDRFAGSYSNAAEWQARAETIRREILRGADLDPLPARTPLNAVVTGKRTHEGYTVENVAFESLPGFYVFGNLYRPAKGDGLFAGILCPHGHFRAPNQVGRFRDDMQIRCATLARMGAVVFAWDMAGWGESGRFGVNHNHPKAVALQLYSGIRAVDFLLSLDGVDPARIGVTGASGGGTQTFLLAAVDGRIAASVPVVMVSAHFFGGCSCESGMPIHKSARHETNNAEIAALAAPRSQLIISVGADWTKNTPKVEFPYIRNVYALLGAGDRVENLHLGDEKHDFGPSKRAGLYRFLARHLALDLDRVRNPDGTIDESGIVIEKMEDLCVLPSLDRLADSGQRFHFGNLDSAVRIETGEPDVHWIVIRHGRNRQGPDGPDGFSHTGRSRVAGPFIDEAVARDLDQDGICEYAVISHRGRKHPFYSLQIVALRPNGYAVTTHPMSGKPRLAGGRIEVEGREEKYRYTTGTLVPDK